MFDYSASAGNNYDKAQFRLWHSEQVEKIRAVVVLVPGSNGDGRSWVENIQWQQFATQHDFALVGCYFTDKPHAQSFIEQYVKVADGSGQAFLDALADFAKQSGYPELAAAPLLLWGMSAGGQFNYEFVAWKPERVLGFVVNKGGIYYSALLSEAARSVPGLLFVGEKDSEFRTNAVVGLFALNRRAGALWALVCEPNIAHDVGYSQEFALMFFEDILPLRLPNGLETGASLLEIDSKFGFIADLKTKTFTELTDSVRPNYPTAWFPTYRTADAWQDLVASKGEVFGLN